MANIVVQNGATLTAEDRTWVYQDPGVWSRASITLDVTKFTAATHYPEGFIPSGVLLGKITATGLYGPYDKSATDGRQVPDMFLYDSIAVNPSVSAKEVVAGLMFGFILERRLPAASGVDADAKAALPMIKFVNPTPA